MEYSSKLFLERRLALLYGSNSMTMRALDLVCEEMCVEKGHKRFDGSDYFMHCVDVANFLITYDITDENAIAAALLHDMVEDVPGYTVKLLENLFNERVAYYVDLVSCEKELDYHDEKVLTEYLEKIGGCIYAAAIKTADRMHNMYTLKDTKLEKRYKKALETEQFFIPFFKACRKKYPRYENLFQAAKIQILPQLYEIKDHYEHFAL